jgi:16S rRNA G966 N2-methylase RsmD
MLTYSQKELRKIEKKIRRQKEKSNWNMVLLSELESQRDSIKEKIMKENNQTNKLQEEGDTSLINDMEYVDPPVNNHKIPNNREMRLLRKKTIQKLNDHLMSEHMNKQMELRINIINQMKQRLEEGKN